MSPIGPSFPPHLSRSGVSNDESESDSDSPGPQPPVGPTRSAGKKVAGPTLPPHLQPSTGSREEEPSKFPPASKKRKRVAGPTLPPAPLDEKPSSSSHRNDKESESESESEDDYGPALPRASSGSGALSTIAPSAAAPGPTTAVDDQTKGPVRAEWMTMGPTSSTSSLNFDPSRHRARGFNTKPTGISGGKPSSSGLASEWTETPEEKRKRLANEILGISTVTGPTAPSVSEKKRKVKAQEDAATAERLSRRGEQSLMESHTKKHKKSGDVEDDDPSKRGFDWEKDMNAGLGKGTSNRSTKTMVNKAANEFSGRFSGGKFL